MTFFVNSNEVDTTWNRISSITLICNSYKNSIDNWDATKSIWISALYFSFNFAMGKSKALVAIFMTCLYHDTIDVIYCTSSIYCVVFVCTCPIYTGANLVDSKICRNAIICSCIFECFSSCFFSAFSKASSLDSLTWYVIFSKSYSVRDWMVGSLTNFLFLHYGTDFSVSTFLFSSVCEIVFPLLFPCPSSSFPLDISLVSGFVSMVSLALSLLVGYSNYHPNIPLYVPSLPQLPNIV